MKISDDIIQQLKQIDLIDIVGHYVQLKRSGSQHKGLCPFHSERTPSFFVSPSKGYYCFGCEAAGGDAIDFIMAVEQKTFAEACEQLAGMYGVILGGTAPSFRPQIKPKEPPKALANDFIPCDLIKANLAYYNQNNLYLFLASILGEEMAGNLCQKYGIGSSLYFGEGTTLFAQRDINGNYRQVKVILYDLASGKRRKDITPLIIGRSPKLMGKGANLVQCFFGEHLLRDCHYPVAIVESEKTAAICSCYYPQFVWIATGGKSGCNMTRPDVNKVLKGRHIHLFPDVDGINDWNKASDELIRQGFSVFVNDIMANNAPKGSKEDIADLILRANKPLPSESATPQWYIDMQGILRRYSDGEITGDRFFDLQDQNWQQSGLTMQEYVKNVRRLDGQKQCARSEGNSPK